MDEDAIYFETDSSGYLGSLIVSRQHLRESPELLDRLDAVIKIELELALVNAQRAKNEMTKLNSKDVIRPIK